MNKFVVAINQNIYPKKILSLQGVRAIAIFLIFLSHTQSYLSPECGIFEPLFHMGGTSVYTFFLLSGFLYTIRGDRFIDRKSYKNPIMMAWRKVKKLYPLHVIMMFFVFFAKWPETLMEWGRRMIEVFFNLTLSQSLVPGNSIINSLNGPAWFLSSLFWVWVLIFSFPKILNLISCLSRNKALIVAVLIIATLQVYQLFVKDIIELYPEINMTYDWLVYFNPLWNSMIFITGACVGRFVCDFVLRKTLANFFQFFTFFLFIGYFWFWKDYLQYTGFAIIMIIASLGIVTVIPKGSFGENILSCKIMVALGDISGYFFLIHGAINFMIRSFVEQYLNPPYLFFLSLFLSLFLSFIVDRVTNRIYS